MFSRNRDSSKEEKETVIHRKTFEQIELEQMSEILDEMREEIKALKESIPDIIRNELKTFRAKFESWENINSMMDSLKQREQELRARENQQLELRTIVPELRAEIHQAVKEAVDLRLGRVHVNLEPDRLREDITKDEGNCSEIHPSGKEMDGGV
jgi:chromosome segregation ATPase